jgi:hypothetical protein
MTKDTSTASSAGDAKASSANAAAGSSSDGGAAAEDAQASVLAQHELTKVRAIYSAFHWLQACARMGKYTAASLTPPGSSKCLASLLHT